MWQIKKKTISDYGKMLKYRGKYRYSDISVDLKSPQIKVCMWNIPQHNNLSPTSLLITWTLTSFVAGATNQPDKQTQSGSYLRAGRVRPMKPSIIAYQLNCGDSLLKNEICFFLLLNTKEEILNKIRWVIKQFLVHMGFHKIFWLMPIVFLALQWKLRFTKTV